MKVQIELTTRCNFDCFYCAGRDMTQADMPLVMFNDLMERHVSMYGVPEQVSLQGEGEPTLHKDFFTMASAVRAIGSEPFTITNGTHKHPEWFIPLFSRIGVSIDTLDSRIATKIGRHNLPRTIAFVDALSPYMDVTVYTVALAKDLPNVGEFCRERGLKHIVQPLQKKPDYSHRYANMIQTFERPSPFSCSYLRKNLMRYYDVNGKEMPCCFIKNGEKAPEIDEMKRMECLGQISEVCLGCHYGVLKHA